VVVGDPGTVTYLFGRNHDSNLFNSFCELIWLNGAVVVQIEVLEALEQDLLLGGGSRAFLLQLILQFFLETKPSDVSKLEGEQPSQGRLTLLSDLPC
jgi:hypothetical protein